MDTFRKVEINILLLDVIKQVSRYAKFLKGLCISKKAENKRNNNSWQKHFCDFAKMFAPEVQESGNFLDSL